MTARTDSAADPAPAGATVPVGRGSSAAAGNMTRTTATGLRWSYLAAASNAALQIGYVAAMSRLLSREAFGLMAMAQIAVNFGMFFARMGVTQTLIQQSRVTPRDLRVSATTSTLLGIGVGAAAWLASPAIAGIYEEPDVVPVLQALSLTFVLIGIGITSTGLLRRQMRFREIALIDMAAAAASIVVGLASAVAGAGVYSLVAATLTNVGLTTLLRFWRARYSLVPLWDWGIVRSLYSSGSRFSLLRMTEFLGRNLDTLMVGRYLSTAVTGVYSRSYTLINMAMRQYLSMAISNVLFPSFAAVQDDRDRLRRGVRGILMLAAFVLVPIAAGMGVAADEIVGVMLGRKFADGAVLIPIFAGVAALSMLSHIMQMAAEALGDLNRTIAVQVGTIAALFLMLLAVAGRPAWAFAGALAASEVLRQIAFLRRLHVSLDLHARDVLIAYTPALIGALVVAGAVAASRVGLLRLSVPLVVVLAGEVVAGGLGLLLTLRLLPVHRLRVELRRRLRAAGLLERGPVARVVALVLGPPPRRAA